MDITHLIAHPEELDQETLYDLRRLVAVHPTYHAARILFLQNLFLLHDPTFDQELRRAALLVPDRRVLFALTQHIAQRTKTANIIVKQDKAEVKVAPAATQKSSSETTVPRAKRPVKKYAKDDTTAQLLDNFLDNEVRPLQKKRIKADPTTDYMSYLLQQEEGETALGIPQSIEDASTRLDSLIDSFIASQEEGITLPENPSMPDNIIEEYDDDDAAPTAFGTPLAQPEEERAPAEAEQTAEGPKPTETGAGELSETLAQIYIKQQKYDRAIEVLGKIDATEQPSGNPYLKDQMRFLQKLARLKGRGKKN